MANSVGRVVILTPLVVFGIGMVGSVAVESGMSWYRTLTLPPWTPPGQVIGFAWSMLFLLVTISIVLVWMRVPRGWAFTAIQALYAVQALCFLGWTTLFFGGHAIVAAGVVSAVYACAIIAGSVLVWPHSREAAIVQIPHAAWVCFATALTVVVWTLNRG